MQPLEKISWRPVVVASLGYFVDILDLFLFSVLRVPSLKAVGVPDDLLLSKGMLLLNSQMSGLLVGSFIWGILGDKKGRVKALYGSIFLYSAATLLNAFVTSVDQYVVLRFIAGIGLAGELGAAITLVSEVLPTSRRGIGTTLVAGVGLMGGIVAASLSKLFDWKTCYLIGGIAGFLLLWMRLKLPEPALFAGIVHRQDKGDLRLFLGRPERIFRLLKLVVVGVPIWFVSGILMVFAPEFGRELNISEGPVTASNAVLYSYIGVALGDFLSGGLSQAIRSRRKAILAFLLFLALQIFIYLNLREVSATAFYGVCFVLGIGTGYWAVLLTMAAEQFGTNLRATVTTLAPNLIRASVIPMSVGFELLRPHLGLVGGALALAAGVLVLSLLTLFTLPETFTRDLSFVEES